MAGWGRTSSNAQHAITSTQAGGMVDLGTLGGTTSIAKTINDNGTITGWAMTSAGASHAFVWTQAGGMVDLGTFGGSFSDVAGINGSGTIAGYSATSSGETHPFVWTQAAGMVDLGTLGGSYGDAAGITDDGRVTGRSTTSTGESHSFIWSQAGGMVDLGTLGGSFADAMAVSNNGTVTGTSATSAGDLHAFVWTQAGGMVDLGTLGGSSSQATGINDNDAVVGYSDTSTGESHAFIWTQAGGMVDLGTLGGAASNATAINNSGVVVGTASDANGVQQGFVWKAGLGMVSLAVTGYRTSAATAVSEQNQIVGWMSTGSSKAARAVLWVLGPTATVTVPADNAAYPVNSAVTVDYSCTDDVSVVSCTGPVPTGSALDTSTPGTDTFSVTATDNEGHTTTTTVSYVVNDAVDLGTLGGAESRAFDVNVHGTVIGYSQTSSGAEHGFVWTQAGGMVDLGTFGGDSSYAVDINDAGQVVGTAYAPGNGSHAYVWTQAGGMVDLGTLGGDTSIALAISENGRVVGSSTTAGGVEHAFSWTPTDGMVDLGSLGGIYARARAVNDHGLAVGSWGLGSNDYAFAWTPSGGAVDLGTLGGTRAAAMDVNSSDVVVGHSFGYGGVMDRAFTWTASGGLVDLQIAATSRAWDINDAGQIVGEQGASQGGPMTAFSWTPSGGVTQIGTLGGAGSTAVAVNELGEVAGTSDVAHAGGGSDQHAFRWNAAAGIEDLGTLGGTYSDAEAINDNGWVVGWSTTASGHVRATLWKRQGAAPDTTPPVATITSPVDASTYPLLTGTATDYSCTDDVAVQSCSAPVASGAPVPATTPGPASFQVTATDTTGNTASASVSYTVSNVLADGLGLTGSFTAVPTPVTVADAPAPDGVTVTVSGLGTDPVRMDLCGGFLVALSPGTVATLTCGSLQASVSSGQATVTTPDGTVQMVVPAGGSGVLSASGAAQDLGGAPITVYGPLSALVLSPATAVVGTSVYQTFTVRGVDPAGHDLGDLTGSATFTISPTGTCTLNACRATTVGARTVTATVGTVSGTATLDVRTRQTITFGSISTKTMLQSPLALTATASSGLPVTFTSSTPAVCTTGGTNGSTLTFVAAGSCTVQADQAGDATYGPAVPVVRTFTINKASQTITFATLSAKTITQSPVVVSATASSGLPVTFTTTTPTVCTASGADGSSIVLLDAGTCTVRAEQAGDDRYNAANPVPRSFTVSKLTNTITFATISAKTLAQSPIVVSATASSGLPVTFSATTPTVCTSSGADGSTITLLAAGTCTVRADQAGDATYRAATPVPRSFTVNKVAQTITFPTIGTKTLAQSPVVVTATASSGLPVTFSTITPTVCTSSGADGSTITLLTTGTCTVRADQAGDDYWRAATSVTRNITVTLPPPAIVSFGATPTLLGSSGGTVQLSATANYADSCRFSVSPTVAGLPLTVPCTSGTATASVTLPPNTTTSSRNYTFSLAALRTGATTATATPVVVRVSPAGVSVADLSVTATDSFDPAFLGEDLTYSVAVANAGPDAAPNVTLTATLPGNTMFTSASGSQGSCAEAAGVVTCTLGSVAAGANATVTIHALPVIGGAGPLDTSVTSTATEANPADNQSSQYTSFTEAKIVYSDDQTSTIYTMSPYGSPVAITTQLGSKSDPVLSPDRRLVAYSRQDPTTYHWEVWVVGIDGSNEHLIADIGTSMVVRPSWSPDGTKLTFTVLGPGIYKAMVADAIGPPNAHFLVADTTVGEMYPAFTPDGASIIFRDTCARPAPGSCRYFRINADGSGTPTSYDSYPTGNGTVMDPTGTWFYYVSGYSTIYRARLDGTLAEPIATNAYGGTYWSLSPNGDKIAYTEQVGGKNVTSVIGVDGTNHRQLTTAYAAADPAGCYSPVWSWDQTRVIMHCYPGSGAIGIYQVSAAATTPTAPTAIGGSFRSRNPDWAGSRPTS